MLWELVDFLFFEEYVVLDGDLIRVIFSVFVDVFMVLFLGM